MRKKHRIMLVSLCAIMIVVSSVMLTLAYLTSETEKVVNTFTVGNVKFDENLNNGLDEAKTNENGNGKPVDKNNNETNDKSLAPRVTKNEYKLVPGHTYTKDPTIHLDKDSEDCYLFVKVVNGLTKTMEDGTKDSIEAATKEGEYTNIAGQMEDKGWKPIEDRSNIYVYVGTGGNAPEIVRAKSIEADRNKVVFEEFKIRGNVNADKLDEYKDKTITITAYAVQADGFGGKKGSDIWSAAAFDS